MDGDAESAAAGTGNAVTVALPGWTTTGGMTAIRYGLSAYPSSTSPGPDDRGSAFFSGGTSGTSTMSQTVDVSDRAASTDAGALTCGLSGWLGGYQSQGDSAKVTATFRDSSGTSLGSVTIGPVTAANRASTTGLLQRSTTSRVPVGTRTVTVVVTATRSGGTNNDGYADSLSLTLQ